MNSTTKVLRASRKGLRAQLRRWIGSPWTTTFRELLDSLEALVGRPDSHWSAAVRLLLATVAAWFAYVPLHELLHALGCAATGGSVEELQIAPLYGGRWLESIFPFVQAGGEYAGRLTRFDTGGSDLVSLATDLAPYSLTVLGAFPLLRAARRRRSAVLLGLAVVLVSAPLISLTGDYYEMGSILVSGLLGAGYGPGDTSPWDALRHDDLFALLGEFPSRFGGAGLRGGAAVAAAVTVGALLAGWTLGAGIWLADRLSRRGRHGSIRPPLRRRLPAPLPADPRHRRLFHPRHGWFRRLERRVNQILSLHLFPFLPGMAGLYAMQLESGLTVSEAEVPVAGLAPELDGTGVLLVTDIHAGPFLTPPALRRVFDRLRLLDPDLILLGGDLTTNRIEELEAHRPLLESLRAPLGVFAVLGNHDHYNEDPPRLRALLESCGIVVLHNRSVIIQRGAGKLFLCGIDDLTVGNPDLGAALRERRDDLPTVLLSHNPDVFFDAAGRGVDLVLAGHTHGGQIRIPGLPVLVRMSRYRLDHGRFEKRGVELVVSRGLGVTGMPLRLACAPEAIFLRLRRAAPRRRPD